MKIKPLSKRRPKPMSFRNQWEAGDPPEIDGPIKVPRIRRCSNCAQLESEALLAVRMITEQHKKQSELAFAIILDLLGENKRLREWRP